MHEFVELLRAIAWPLTTLAIVLILRVELQRFAKNVADRIRSASSVTIGPRGVELRGLLKAVPVPADLQTRKVALINSVRALHDKRKLDAIADLLGLPHSTDGQSQKNDLILVLNARIDSQSELNRLSSALKPVVGREF